MILLVALTLLPLAIYCYVLALVNKRRQPVIVSGVWDFVGTLFGASGFLLFIFPYVLNSLNDRWLENWLLSPGDADAEAGDAGHHLWLWIRVGYCVLVVIGAAILLFRRRRVLSVYNIQPARMPELLGQVLDGLQLPWTRLGDEYYLLGPSGRVADTGVNGARVTAAHASSVVGKESRPRPSTGTLTPTTTPIEYAHREKMPLLHLDLFHSLHHVGIRWQPQANAVRPRIEAELRRTLADVTSHKNPAALWFMSFACGLFVVLFFIVAAWIAMLLILYHRNAI